MWPLSIVQMVFTFAVMWAYTHIQARAAVPLNMRPGDSAPRHAPGLWTGLLAWGSVVALLILVLAPLLALLDRSFSLGGSYTLRYYEALFVTRLILLVCSAGRGHLSVLCRPTVVLSMVC
jgi:ABC-type Fe3+ transport system permease subunit